VLKICTNSIPPFPSKQSPEQGLFTNDPRPTISVEFNKAGFSESPWEYIHFETFNVDSVECLANATVLSTVEGAYHFRAKAEYQPSAPLSDGPHDVVVLSRSNVGPYQTMWSFIVDTQAPTISIEALQPYSPRAPNAEPLSIRYKTSDNLSTFLRALSFKLYDKSGNYITKIATFDVQSVGENYVTLDPEQLKINGQWIVDGVYSIKATLSDQAGNVTTESVALTIDSTPPTILEANVSPKPMTSNSDSMNFNAELSENSIVTIKMINKATNVASAYIAQAQSTAFYSWSYNNQFGISGPEDGLYKIEVTARDAAGNVCDPYVIDNVRIDRTPPVVFANACLPYVLANIGDDPYTTTLNYQISESNDKAENQVVSGQGLGVRVKLFNENTGELIRTWSNAPADIGSINEVVWNGNSANIGKGAYKFQITATDAVGNLSNAYSTCVKDGVAPIISFPAKDQVVSGSIAIRGTAIDPDWTNNLPFNQYRIYYAKGEQSAPGNLDALGTEWKSDFVEVPEINRAQSTGDGAQKNISIRPLQNDSTLAYLYSAGLENGTYTLLVVAEEDGGETAACIRVIKVKNDEITASYSTDPVVKLNPLPQRIHFDLEGRIKLPISFINGIKTANVNLEIKQVGSAGTNEGIVFHKYMPSVRGNKYTGKPTYQPGQNLGYYIWSDELGWHIRWSADGSSHHFTGNLMAVGQISDIITINWSRPDASGQATGLINWDTSMSGGEGGIDFSFNGSMLILTPKIDEDPASPSFTADNVYLGMTNATEQYLPIMINTSAEGVAPETVEWDGKLDTGGFVDSGVYTIRIRAEGADGIGLATDEAQIEVETEYDISNIETVNKTFSSVGALAPTGASGPDRVSVYFNLSKDSYISAYVYDGSSPNPVCTITTESFMMGNMNQNRKHVISWKGNYPMPDSALMFTGGDYYMKLIATSADGSDHKEVRIDDINIKELIIDVNQARLDQIGDKVPYNGVDSQVAEGSSPYYWEATGSGKLYPPKHFSYSLTPFGKQKVTTYPYVPFAMLIHRGYRQVDVKMDVILSGTIREKYLPTNDTQWHTDYFNYSSLVKSGLWGFRDEGVTDETTSVGSACVVGIRVGSDQVAESKPLVKGLDKLTRDVFFEGSLLFGSGGVRDSQLWFWGDQTITINFYTQRSGSTPSFILDTLRIPATYVNKYVPSDKGIFKAKILMNATGRYTCNIDVQAELEAPIKYSRLTNRFMPFFGFVNKNHPSTWYLGAADIDINRLGFPGNDFFNNSNARPYDEFNELVKKAAEKKGLSTDEIYRMLRDLKNQKNYTGVLGTTICTSEHRYYLSDPITSEYSGDGIEFISITTPDKGKFDIEDLNATASSTYEMSVENNNSLFTFNFPSSPDEINYFKNTNDARLDRFSKSPSIWTGISMTSPHELDVNSVIQTAESKAILGQDLRYDKSLRRYYYKSDPAHEMYEFDTELYKNATGVKFRVSDLSDPDVSLNLEEGGEVGKAASLTGTLLNPVGIDWTTNIDPVLYPFGGKITGLYKTFNENAFSDRSDYMYVNEPYTLTIFKLQNMDSPNKLYYTFWKYDPLAPTSEVDVPIDNPSLVYDPWEVTLRDLSGAVNSDLIISNESYGAEPHFNNDRFKVKLRLDSAEKKYVEIKGKAAGDYYLMYFDGKSWNTIKHSDAPAEGTLGWWNVSRLNGKYTVVLKVSDKIIATQDILVGSVVKPDKGYTVSSPYKRAEVSFKEGAFPQDQLVTVTPVRMDELDLSNRPSVPTIGPIVELKPSPYTFKISTTEGDFRPTLSFKYTKEDLLEMYPYLKVDITSEVMKLDLNIHQVTENGGVQIISGNKQSYSDGIYSFEGPLDHFSEYALIKGKYDIMAPTVQTDNYIVNFSPITVYGTAPAESKLYVHVDTIEAIDTASIELRSPFYVPASDSGSYQYKFINVEMAQEGNNYVFVVARKSDIKTVSHIKVRYDKTAPSVEASADIDSFSPNRDGRLDSVTYRLRSNETGKLYFILKDPKGDSLINNEIACGANELVRVMWDGEKVYIDQDGKEILLGRTDIVTDGKYDYIVFAVDEAGNISNNIVGFTYVDRAPPVISNLSATPNPFTPAVDGLMNISFEVSETSRFKVNILRGDVLFFESEFSIPYAPGSNPCFAWDGKGEHGEIIGGSYSYRIVAEDLAGNIATSDAGTIYVNSGLTLINYAYFDPSFFSTTNQRSSSSKLKYGFLKNDLKVYANIYDDKGTLIKALLDYSGQASGDHETLWNGEDEFGRKLGSGPYKFTLKAADQSGTMEEISGNVVIDNDPPAIEVISIEAVDDTAICLYSVSEEAKVTISAVDEDGNIVQVLTSQESMPAGEHSISWLFASRVTDYSLRYSFKISAEDGALNTAERSSALFILPGPVNIMNLKTEPETFNPNSSTMSRKTAISYQLASKKGKAVVSVKVISPAGEIVKTLTDAEEKENGTHSIEWHGENYLGSNVAPGTYEVQITASDIAGNMVRRSVDAAIAPYTSRLILVNPKVITPNISNMNITFKYEIIGAGDNVTAKVKILTEAGATVRTLDHTGASGTCTDVWDGMDEYGKQVTDGKYRYEISTDDNLGSSVTFTTGDIAVLLAQTITVTTDPKILSSNTPNGAITIGYKIDYKNGIISGNSNVTMNIKNQYQTQVYYFSDTKSEGNYTHLWDGTSNTSGGNGGKVPNGLYSLYVDSIDPIGSHYTYQPQLQVYTSLPQISNITSESYLTTNLQNYFNPYTDGGIYVGFNGSHVVYPITVSSEVWLGNILIKKLKDAKFFSEGVAEISWDGTNEAGDYVNEGEYKLKLRAFDDYGNISPTYEYTIKVQDDQKLTDISSFGAYSRYPDLKLVGSQLNLRFMTGECWGDKTLQFKAADGEGGGGGNFALLFLSKDQQIYSQVWGNGNGYPELWWNLRNEDDTGPDLPNGYFNYSAGVYRAYAMGVGGNWWEANYLITYSEPTYNSAKLYSSDIWLDSPSISESKYFESSASYISGASIKEHCVWPSTSSGSHYFWGGNINVPNTGINKFNSSEIIYSTKTNGGFDVYTSWHQWLNGANTHLTFLQKEIRLSNALGNSINPAIACDSTGQKVYVVWEDYRSGKGEVFFNKSIDAGDNWLASEARIITSAGNCITPSIACDPSGNVLYVIYSDNSGALKELRFIKSSDGGTTWTSSVRITINSFSGCNTMRPSIVVDANGDAYVAWEDTRTGTSEIFFQKVPHNFAPITSSGMTTLAIHPAKTLFGIEGKSVIMSGLSSPELISPIGGATVNSLRPTFKWYGLSGWKYYMVECAITSDADALSTSSDKYDLTIDDEMAARVKPLCEFTQSEHYMGLDESTPNYPYWYWRVRTTNTSEVTTSEVGSFRIELPVSLSGVTNWPNPFNPNKEATKIRYRLGRQADSVTIRIYDITGALVRELDGSCNAEGTSVWNKYNDVAWDGRNGRGDIVLNGVYPFEVTVSCGNKSVSGRGKAVVLK
jgi:flagellar hook assembly protein FlgD